MRRCHQHRSSPNGFLDLVNLLVSLDTCRRSVAWISAQEVGLSTISDIHPLANAAAVYGFEPDREECAKLNRSIDAGSHPFGSIQFLPEALGRRRERRTLNIMQHVGASSLLAPNTDVTGRFGPQAAYFNVAHTMPVDTTTLDQVIEDYDIVNPVYMKIDVEGFELEILKGAEQLLSSTLLAVRSEVAFLPCRVGQPDFGELSAALKRFRLMPMDFLYFANWRSLTGAKHPRKVGGPIPYSRGQMVHGDVLFLRDPMSLNENSEADIKAKLCLAFLALLYDYVDFAYDIFRRPAVNAYLREQIGSDGMIGLRQASQFLSRRHDRRSVRLWGRNLIKRVTSEIKHVFA